MNGVLQTLTTDSNSTGTRNSDSSATQYIGNSQAGTRTVDGMIDQVRLYNYTRTPAQIAWEYNRGGPIAHWKFDECSGSTANDNAGNIAASTIYSQTGNAVGTCGGSAGDMWADGAGGKRNASLAFDGTDDYVLVPDNDKLSFGDSVSDRPFSISAWLNMSDATGFKVILKCNDSSDQFEYNFG